MSGSPLAHWAMAQPNQYPGSNINSTILRIALNIADIRSIDKQDLKAIESILSKVIAWFLTFYNEFGRKAHLHLKKHKFGRMVDASLSATFKLFIFRKVKYYKFLITCILILFAIIDLFSTWWKN